MAALVVGAIVLAMRCVPVYNEYFGVKKALSAISTNNEANSPEAIRNFFDRRASVDDITSVKPSDLVISKENGRWSISAEWQRTVPLVANVSLLFEFSASSSADDASGS